MPKTLVGLDGNWYCSRCRGKLEKQYFSGYAFILDCGNVRCQEKGE